jgi:hypothetical protein
MHYPNNSSQHAPIPRHQIRHRGAHVPPIVSTVEPRFRGGLASCLTNLVRPRRLVRLACLTDSPSVAWSADTGGPASHLCCNLYYAERHLLVPCEALSLAPSTDWRPSPLNTIGAASREAQEQGPHGCVWSWHTKTAKASHTSSIFAGPGPAGGRFLLSRARGTQAAGPRRRVSFCIGITREPPKNCHVVGSNGCGYRPGPLSQSSPTLGRRSCLLGGRIVPRKHVVAVGCPHPGERAGAERTCSTDAVQNCCKRHHRSRHPTTGKD